MSAQNKISVLITRSEDDSRDLRSVLDELDFSEEIQFSYIPVMKIESLPLAEALHTEISAKDSLLIFTSQNAVEAVMSSGTNWNNAKIAAIGERTATAIKNTGHEVSFIPSEARADIFVPEFVEHLKQLGIQPHIYLFQGNTAPDTLLDDLESKSCQVKKIICYEVQKSELTVRHKNALDDFIASVKSSEGIHIVCVLSSLQAEFLLSYLDESDSSVLKAKVQTFAIGQTTAQTLHRLGFKNVHKVENSSLREIGIAVKCYIKEQRPALTFIQ